ncbi:unnamed protein product [Agarophyton chilense]
MPCPTIVILSPGNSAASNARLTAVSTLANKQASSASTSLGTTCTLFAFSQNAELCSRNANTLLAVATVSSRERTTVPTAAYPYRHGYENRCCCDSNTASAAMSLVMCPLYTSSSVPVDTADTIVDTCTSPISHSPTSPSLTDTCFGASNCIKRAPPLFVVMSFDRAAEPVPVR